jgi:hypothetical protein
MRAGHAPTRFFDLSYPHRWRLPLEDRLRVGPPGRMFMFGGVGMAATSQTCIVRRHDPR